MRTIRATLTVLVFSILASTCTTARWEPRPQRPSSKAQRDRAAAFPLAADPDRMREPTDRQSTLPATEPSVTGPSATGPAVTGTSATGPAAVRTPRSNRAVRSLAGKHIVVDAGHGGRDPGATGVTGVLEKTVNLAMALELARCLRRRGARVTLTRARDVFLTLDFRAIIADRTKTDLFVSVHADSAPRREASGATLYIAKGASPESRRTAESIRRSFRESGVANLGIRTAQFRVLVGHSRPAILVECGFLSNPEDARRLERRSYRQKLAESIADGVLDAIATEASRSKSLLPTTN